jgi:short-subunit dehydrogenase
VAFETRDLADGAVLLLGGRSEIGLEVTRRIAPGRTVVLAARRSVELAAETALLREAGASAVVCVEFDADDTAAHPALLESIAREHGPIAVAVVAFGVLGDQRRAERDAVHAVSIVHTDFAAQVGVLTVLANILRGQPQPQPTGEVRRPRPRGHLVVFSSVAGVRVRRANYVYGSAKAGLDGFASGLADALHGSGVHLLLVRPGFVIGRMTAGMDAAPLSSTPPQVADAVVSALYRHAAQVAVPAVLRLVFVAMRLVPQALWRRLPR